MTEAAVAVYMLVIINGYVALSQLNTQYYYIIATDIGAAAGWGFIDSFTYVVGQLIDRGGRASILEKIQSEKVPDKSIGEVIKELDGTFVSHFSFEGKRNIAKEILKNSAGASVRRERFLTRDDLGALASILGIYMTAGIALSVSYFVFTNKLNAWIVSNLIGIVWLFYYGYTVGKIVGQKRIIIGILTSSVGIALLVVSYLRFG